MEDGYCHLCDSDPCYCGQKGQVTHVARKSVDRGAPRGLDTAVRQFVLDSHVAGTRADWVEWEDRISEEFNDDDIRSIWNRVSNGLQRDGLLITHPIRGGYLMPPSHYPDVRRLSVPDAVIEVEALIERGGWSNGEAGLRLWQVVHRIGDVLYISIYDALHDMNSRQHRVTTVSPAGKP